MKKKILLAVFAALIAAGFVFANRGRQSSGGFTLKEGILLVGIDIGYPPMEYWAADGSTLTGFDVELGKAIAEKLGLKVEFIDQTWEGIFAGLNTGKYDCIISSVTITNERLAAYNLTRPYITNTQAMIVRTDSGRGIQTPFEVEGLQVAVQGRTTSDKFMSGLAEAGLDFTLRRYDQAIHCFIELRNGRVDAVVCDSVAAYFYANDPLHRYNIVWEDDVDEVLGICFRKGNDALSNAVDDILAGFFEDGTLLRLSESIFHQDLISPVKFK